MKTKTIHGDLILKKNTIIKSNLVVEVNIWGYYNLKVIGNIDAWNINARNIDAWNIIFCDKIKVKIGCKVICKVLITDRFNIERKEQKLGEQK